MILLDFLQRIPIEWKKHKPRLWFVLKSAWAERNYKQIRPEDILIARETSKPLSKEEYEEVVGIYEEVVGIYKKLSGQDFPPKP